MGKSAGMLLPWTSAIGEPRRTECSLGAIHLTDCGKDLVDIDFQGLGSADSPALVVWACSAILTEVHWGAVSRVLEQEGASRVALQD